ncbi:MAG: peptidoglycan editing factor PgeF [Pseudomonadota bacterium]
MTLERLTSDLIAPTLHGFFTRRGGASSGVFDGLNCGPGSSDQAEMVQINLARVADAMGVGTDALLRVHQVHSATAVPVSAPFADARPRADGLATATPGIAISVLTADCAPVLFSDPDARIIGAAHAGWKGALGGVLEATLVAMERLGATRGAIRAAIGPTISQRAYEVGPEFMDAFVAEDPQNTRFFSGGAGDRMHFDLPSYALARLREAGVHTAEWIQHCTYSDSARFFSYRRSVHNKEADYGRLIASIRL